MAAEKIVIRPFEWRDVDALWERMQDDEILRWMPTDHKPTQEESVDYFDKELKKGSILLVADAGGTAVGSVDVRRREGKRSHVGDIGIAVRRSHWGRGIAKTLLAEAEKAAREAGFKKLRYGCAEKNTASVRLAKGAGFRYVGRYAKEHKLGDEYHDYLIFEKWLG